VNTSDDSFTTSMTTLVPAYRVDFQFDLLSFAVVGSSPPLESLDGSPPLTPWKGVGGAEIDGTPDVVAVVADEAAIGSTTEPERFADELSSTS